MKPKTVRLLLAVLLALGLGGMVYFNRSPEPPRNVLLPIDEAALDSDLLALRDGLLDAYRRGDLEPAVAAAHENIQLDFGGIAGRENFRQMLAFSEPGDGQSYWRALGRVLELGGVFLSPDLFCTPYLSCIELPGCETEICDGYDSFVAVTEDAPVHAAPDEQSKIIERLAYEIVFLADRADAYRHYPWHEVRLADGRTGFITGPDFRLPVDYRAFFERQDGKWAMTVFVAGD